MGYERSFGDRLLRRGDQGEDVHELQLLLIRAGLDPGPVDGIFGPLTDAAVRAFQHQAGLAVDGVVGPLTRGALLAAGPPPDPSGPRGISMHIGLNNVDPAAYPFPVTPLRGCHNDARSMSELASTHGFLAGAPMLDSAASAEAVIRGIKQAAQSLRSGDIFFLSYAGHGSQVVDVGPEEADRYDETWVLWDRQLLDDELAGLWPEFASGVRIIIFSDSCHSGTVARELAQAALTPTLAAQTAVAIQQSVGLMGSRAGFEREGASGRIATEVVRRLDDDPARARVLPEELATFAVMRSRRQYRRRKDRALQAGSASCHVLLISGCQDDQTSADGRINGLFTEKVLQVMGEGNVVSYTDLHTRVVARMPARQRPNLFWATTPEPSFEAEVPLTV